MQSITENLVLLSRPHQGPGVLVHSEQHGGFVTLSAIRACNLDDDQRAPGNAVVEDPAQNARCRITIGHRKIAIYVSLSDSKTLISNIWVDQGEEVWVSTSHPQQHAVYGFVHNQAKPVIVS